MKKLFFILLALLSGAAYANISLSPFYIEFDANSSNRSAQVRFTNTTNRNQTYNIRMVNFAQSSDGGYVPISTPRDGNPFASTYLEFSPRVVSLEPGESQVVRLLRRGMAGVPDGEYVSHLMIQEDAANVPSAPSGGDGLIINLRPIYGVSIPVMIEKGKLSSTARVAGTKILRDGDKYVADITVERFGNRSFRGTLIVRDNGREIGRVDNFRIFMTTPSRVLRVPLSGGPGDDISVTLIDGTNNETLESKSI